MSTFKINKNKDFTIMSNYHLRDKDLSLKAKGLLSFMLSLPEDWDYSLKGLVAICKENKDAIRSALNELKQNNYLKIELIRGETGKFEYDYIIYEIPYETPLKARNPPCMGNPYTVNPNTENQPQINTKEQTIKEQIDKIDKTEEKIPLTKNEEITHNVLTLELIKLNYVEKDDPLTFYFDNLFQEYLSNGKNYKDLYSSIHYIIPRILSRDFIDENGNRIENKYGYFKNAIDSNFRKFENYSNELFSIDEDCCSLYDDLDGR